MRECFRLHCRLEEDEAVIECASYEDALEQGERFLTDMWALSPTEVETLYGSWLPEFSIEKFYRF